MSKYTYVDHDSNWTKSILYCILIKITIFLLLPVLLSLLLYFNKDYSTKLLINGIFCIMKGFVAIVLDFIFFKLTKTFIFHIFSIIMPTNTVTAAICNLSYHCEVTD